MNYNEQRTQTLEYLIRSYLTNKRLQNASDYTVSMLALYEHITHTKNNSGYTLWLGLPTGIFNKIVGDMKKAGIIGTAKGGEVVFLSNGAWELAQSTIKKIVDSEIEKANQAVQS